MRLPLETAKEVRARWPADKPMFVRLSCIDHGDSDWTIADTVAVCNELKALGVDVIDCSSGGLTGYLVPKGEIPAQGHQVPYAEQIKRETGVRTMAVGMIKLFTREMADRVCSAAIQTLGGYGYGYVNDFPLERIYRDVRVCQIYEGTSDI